MLPDLDIPPTNVKDVVKMCKDFAEAGVDLACMPMNYAHYLKEAGRPVKRALVLAGSIGAPLLIGNAMRSVIGETMTEATPIIAFAASYGISCIVSATAMDFVYSPKK